MIAQAARNCAAARGGADDDRGSAHGGGGRKTPDVRQGRCGAPRERRVMSAVRVPGESTNASAPSELAAHDLSVHFDGLSALENVDLSVRRGQILGLIGPNGAGKTTLVNVLTGFQSPSLGAVRFGGQDVTHWPPHRIRRAGVSRTFQAGRLFRDLPVSENVEASAVNLGLSRRQARVHAREILDWIGLGDKADAFAGSLAYTDERRVGIARALAMNPAFVLLDEPAAGMSDLECDSLMETIAQIPERFGAGVLLIEHNMRVVMGICAAVHVLDGGRTVAQGTPGEVQSNPAVIAAYLGAPRKRKGASRQ
jgi:branched-chain amino acid transport system ATP-binding protein